MLKWLKRAINANYRDLQGANKGLRRLHRKLKFAEMDLDMWARKYNWLSERNDVLLELLNAKEQGQAVVQESHTAAEEGCQHEGIMAQGNGDTHVNGTGVGHHCQSPDMPVLQHADTLAGAIARSQDPKVS